MIIYLHNILNELHDIKERIYKFYALNESIPQELATGT